MEYLILTNVTTVASLTSSYV